MDIIPKLKLAKPYPGFRLHVEFDDDVSGIIDLSKWKNNAAFSDWNNEDNFKNFKITRDKKIEWLGNIDMDPDAFYLQLIDKTFEEYASSKQFLRHSY